MQGARRDEDDLVTLTRPIIIKTRVTSTNWWFKVGKN